MVTLNTKPFFHFSFCCFTVFHFYIMDSDESFYDSDYLYDDDDDGFSAAESVDDDVDVRGELTLSGHIQRRQSFSAVKDSEFIASAKEIAIEIKGILGLDSLAYAYLLLRHFKYASYLPWN